MAKDFLGKMQKDSAVIFDADVNEINRIISTANNKLNDLKSRMDKNIPDEKKKAALLKKLDKLQQFVNEETGQKPSKDAAVPANIKDKVKYAEEIIESIKEDLNINDEEKESFLKTIAESYYSKIDLHNIPDSFDGIKKQIIEIKQVSDILGEKAAEGYLYIAIRLKKLRTDDFWKKYNEEEKDSWEVFVKKQFGISLRTVQNYLAILDVYGEDRLIKVKEPLKLKFFTGFIKQIENVDEKEKAIKESLSYANEPKRECEKFAKVMRKTYLPKEKKDKKIMKESKVQKVKDFFQQIEKWDGNELLLLKSFINKKLKTKGL